jgi:16S rRNA (adenine1518-N6/adenine1519-N6)-dimethyltransferase
VVPAQTARIIFRLARAGFSQRRKKLRNALAAGLHLSPPDAEQRLRAAGVDPSARAETLSLKDWERLAVAWGEEG